MNIAIAVNHKFVRYAVVLLTSVLVNSGQKAVNIFVVCRNLPDKDRLQLKGLETKHAYTVTILSVGENMIPADLPAVDKWPIEVWLRLALPFILPPGIEKLLYLDVDTLAVRDISGLYEADLGGQYFAAVRDLSDGNLQPYQLVLFRDRIAEGDFVYFNSGVLLMDIKKLASDYSMKDFTDTARRLNEQHEIFDQDLINMMFAGRILELPDRFNCYARIRYLQGTDETRI